MKCIPRILHTFDVSFVHSTYPLHIPRIFCTFYVSFAHSTYLLYIFSYLLHTLRILYTFHASFAHSTYLLHTFSHILRLFIQFYVLCGIMLMEIPPCCCGILALSGRDETPKYCWWWSWVRPLERHFDFRDKVLEEKTERFKIRKFRHVLQSIKILWKFIDILSAARSKRRNTYNQHKCEKSESQYVLQWIKVDYAWTKSPKCKGMPTGKVMYG